MNGFLTFPEDCKIVNIRTGSGDRKHLVYADLVDSGGTLLISATLQYITERVILDVYTSDKAEK